MPKFGEWFEVTSAGDRNPLKFAMFVQVVTRRQGMINAGTWWRLTDGRGHFGEFPPKVCVPLSASQVAACGLANVGAHQMAAGVDLDLEAVKAVTRLLTAIVWEYGTVEIPNDALNSVPGTLDLAFDHEPEFIRVRLHPVDEALRQAQRRAAGIQDDPRPEPGEAEADGGPEAR